MVDDRNVPVFRPARNFAAKEIIDVGLCASTNRQTALGLDNRNAEWAE